MDSSTGRLYPSRKAAQDAGVPDDLIVTLAGKRRAVREVASAVKRDKRAKGKAARQARKRNR